MPAVPGPGRAEGEQVAQKAPERLEEDKVVAVRRTGRPGLHLAKRRREGEEGRAGQGQLWLQSQAHGDGWGELRVGLGVPRGGRVGCPAARLPWDGSERVRRALLWADVPGRLPPGWLRTSGMSGAGCTEFCIWLSFSFFSSDERTSLHCPSLHCPSLLSACPTRGARTVLSRAEVEGRGPVSGGLVSAWAGPE